jgi:hypothetical protein
VNLFIERPLSCPYFYWWNRPSGAWSGLFVRTMAAAIVPERIDRPVKSCQGDCRAIEISTIT